MKSLENKRNKGNRILKRAIRSYKGDLLTYSGAPQELKLSATSSVPPGIK